MTLRKGKKNVFFFYIIDLFVFNNSFFCLFQILSKGQVLRTTSFPRYPRGSYYGYLPKSLVPLSQGVTVLAYHYATLGNKSEFIVDSLHVQPTTECDEEVKEIEGDDLVKYKMCHYESSRAWPVKVTHVMIIGQKKRIIFDELFFS